MSELNAGRTDAVSVPAPAGAAPATEGAERARPEPAARAAGRAVSDREA
jgi:hypothetical protein